MTLPKRCCVRACDRRQSRSSIWPEAGEINWANSARVSLSLSIKLPTASGPTFLERSISSASGSALNSATKLIGQRYQLGGLEQERAPSLTQLPSIL